MIDTTVAVQETAQGPESPAGDPENEMLEKYRRSSLYSVLMKHSTFNYGQAIDSAFMAIPVPDKFNDHNLDGLRSFESSAAKQKKGGKKKEETNAADIAAFIAENQIARKMVEKWFSRDSCDGSFDMGLVQQRGNYDASQADINIADRSALGRAILADAGEDLIAKTFLLINDITFVDKGERSAKVGGFIKILGSAMGSDVSAMTDMAALAVNQIDGFTVNITSYLYRLDWNEEVAGHFYTEYWYGRGEENPDKRAAFDASDLFTLSFVGKTTTSAGNLASKSLAKKTKEEQMLKVCTRAVDKAIVELQREYDEFKVNVPLYRVNEDGTVDVQIGLKEGINPRSRFDVLMPVEDENGRVTYKKIGRLKPIEGRIWDNRFGADEDAAALAADRAEGVKTTPRNEDDQGDASLDASTFEVLAGVQKIVPGALVREETIRRDK